MNNRGGSDQDAVQRCFREALDAQRAYLSAYEKPCEPIAYETLRTFDDVFCRDLMEPSRPVDKSERLFRNLSTWGVNHALRRIVPRISANGPFRDFPSSDTIQAQTDDFVFNCGVLAISERLEGWLSEGILTGEIRPYPKHARLTSVLVLRSAMSSYLDEEIGRAGLRWASRRTWMEGLGVELALEERHARLEPELHRRVNLVDGWRVSYSSTRDIDDYFLEWAKLYLRRIFSQDMIGLNDVIGGHPFSRYVEVLSALSARSQKHIAFAAIIRARNPSVHIRNLLTAYCHRESFIESLAEYMDADRREIESILGCFILTGDNIEAHTQGGEVAWAPIVQASTGTLILPTYGLDINPFLFLLTDLRSRYESDWFRVANNRERRWIGEIERLFEKPWWQTNGRNLKLREQGKDLTDIDFAAYQSGTNQLALFQLKWQHPVGIDNRGRRSTGKNLIMESNRWVATVMSWLERHGADDLMQRLGFKGSCSPTIRLFVLGRYHVYLSGYEGRDDRAIWSDWAHFQKTCDQEPKRFSVEQLASRLHSEVERSRAMKGGESMMFPIGKIAVVLNPTSVPEDIK